MLCDVKLHSITQNCNMFTSIVPRVSTRSALDVPRMVLFWSKEAIQRFDEIVTQIAFVPQKGFQLPKKKYYFEPQVYTKCAPNVLT